MSFLLDRLYPASFAGAKFFFTSENRTDGRRTVIHRYPNKGDSVEDIGKDSRVFNITGIVKGFFYKEDAKALEDQLNKEGAAILLHPELGAVNCVCLGFTRSFDLKKLGIIEYSMAFKEVLEEVYPAPTSNVITLIADLYNRFYSFLEEELNFRYVVSTVKNIIKAAEKLSELEDQLGSISQIVLGEANTASDFKFALRRFGKNVYKAASPDGDIGGATTNIIGKFDVLSTDGDTRIALNDKLFGFGFDDIFLNLNTAELIQRRKNAKILNGAINALALINSYDAAKNINYTNDQQIDEVEGRLDKKYEELVESDRVDISTDLNDRINEIRIATKSFFDQERLNINKVIEITTNEIPLTILTYQYYGNTENWDDLLTLNQIYKPERISGTIKIFEV